MWWLPVGVGVVAVAPLLWGVRAVAREVAALDTSLRAWAQLRPALAETGGQAAATRRALENSRLR